MATKIKGEAIKEGSIPLRALADDVKDKLNKIFIMPEDFIEEQYDKPDEGGFFGKVKQVYVTDILENRYTKISADGILGDINIIDDLIMLTFKHEDFQSGQKQERYPQMVINVQDCKFKLAIYLNTSPFAVDELSTDAANIEADIRYDFVNSVTDSEITIPEENKQLFKKNMGSFANWNAQEGEAGYIENKPFYGGNVIRTVGSGVIMSPKSFTINNYYRAKITTFRYYNSEGEYTDIDFDLKTGFASTIVGDGFELYVTYDINYTNATIEFVELTLNGGWIAFFVDEYDTLKALEDKYIPNTVLKTTPQTLSDTDKNQALANLGIDPVVWKYMCKPLKLGVDTVIPEELLVNNGGSWFWKYPVPAIITGTIDENDNYIHAAMGEPILENGLCYGLYIEGLGFGEIDFETRKPLFI